MTTDSINVARRQFTYRIILSERKTLGISVTPELEIIVRAPVNASKDRIREIVKRKARWIEKQRIHFEAFHPRTKLRKYIGGETHLYLGRSYKLKVNKGLQNVVKLKNGEILITVKNNTTAKQVLTNWYRSQAETKFGELMVPIIRSFRKYNVEPSEIKLKAMAKRWGSCTPNGRILLNPELIKAPRICIEYVLIHEMCHLVHHRHTKKFYELQKREMPDWEKWKAKLERLLA